MLYTVQLLAYYFPDNAIINKREIRYINTILLAKRYLKRYSLELGKDWSQYLVRNRTLTKDKEKYYELGHLANNPNFFYKYLF